MAKTRTAARVARLVAQWRTNEGQSAASFARRHGISPWAFWYWQRKLSAQAVPETPKSATFVLCVRGAIRAVRRGWIRV